MACEGSRKSCGEREGGAALPSTSEVGGLVIRLLRQGARGVGELVPSRGLEPGTGKCVGGCLQSG